MAMPETALSYDLRHISGRCPRGPQLVEACEGAARALNLSQSWGQDLRAGPARTLEQLADGGAPTLQAAFEQSEVIAAITAGRRVEAPAGWWATARQLIVTRAIVPSWAVVRRVRVGPLLAPLPAEDALGSPTGACERRSTRSVRSLGLPASVLPTTSCG